MSGPIQAVPNDVGRLLRQARLSAGLSQTELAQRAGLHQSVVSKYEQNAREPSAGRLLRLLAAAQTTSISGRPSSDAAELALPLVTKEKEVGASPGDQGKVDVAGKPTESVDPDSVGPDPRDALKLKQEVIAHLSAQGFHLTHNGVLAEISTDKAQLRKLHQDAVAAHRVRAKPALERLENRFLQRLIRGVDVDPSRIKPRLVLIDDRRSIEGQLWRWCSLHWSIPVSSGYGRRLRFLVVDDGHRGAVMGLIGLGDPVFALGCRDETIGWTREQRGKRLSSVMDAFVLGAVPPYSHLLAGKLMALLAGSEEVRRAFADRYGHRTTLIAQRDPHAELALVTTTSALGRSSVYNRLRRPDASLALVPIGYTGGSGDFHFSGEIYEKLADFARAYAQDRPAHRHERWGSPGFRNRREVIQKGLDALGMDSRALRVHGVKRQVFMQSLAANTNEYLKGETDELEWFVESSTATLSAWWLSRWAIPRSLNDSNWLTTDPEDWRLYG